MDDIILFCFVNEYICQFENGLCRTYEWNILIFFCVSLKDDQNIWIFRLTSNWAFNKRQTEVNCQPKVSRIHTEQSYLFMISFCLHYLGSCVWFSFKILLSLLTLSIILTLDFFTWNLLSAKYVVNKLI